MAKRVYATCNIGKEALQRLTDLGYELEVYDHLEPPPRQLMLEKLRWGVDGLICTLRERIDEEVFQTGKPRLRVVSQYAVGFDNIDREAANRHKIPFTNTPDVLTDTTAEFAFFILGAAARKLYPSEQLVREKKWRNWHPNLPFLGYEVSGKTVSVIGTGRIGRAFITKCSGMNMDILCYDPMTPDPDFIRTVQRIFDLQYEGSLISERRTIRAVTFEEALRQGDFISLHVPLMTETQHLIDARALSLMKPSAFLINTSRGPVVDEQALYEALKNEVIRGAALDVFTKEPLPDDSPLRDPELCEHLRLFHHFASGGYRTRLSPDPNLGMAGRCVQGCIDVLEGNYGGNPANMPFVVNKEAWTGTE
jgi:glyoxylate reductase